MAYCTIAQVTGSAWNVSGMVDASYVSKAISTADALIDMYLDRRYTVPFGSTPTLISEIAVPMARYWGKIFHGHDVNHLGEQDVQMYQHCIDALTDIRDGKMDVPGATEKAATDKVWSTTQDYTPVHDVDDELYHVPDSDRLDDIDDSRD